MELKLACRAKRKIKKCIEFLKYYIFCAINKGVEVHLLKYTGVASYDRPSIIVYDAVYG